MGDGTADGHRIPQLGWRQRLSWWLKEHWEIPAALAAAALGLLAILLLDVNRVRPVLLSPREVGVLADTISRLEAGLGFQAEEATARHENYRLAGHLLVTQVTPGGAMAEAGLREGDTVPYPFSDCLFKNLALGQGKRVAVPVLRGRERLALQVRVPDLGLPAAGLPWICPDGVVPGNAASRVPDKPPGWQ